MSSFAFRLINPISIFFAIFIIFPIVWMAADRQPPFEIKRGWMSPPVASEGDRVTVVWEIKPIRTCMPEHKATVTRYFIDKYGIRHTATSAPARYSSDQSETDRIRNVVTIPAMPEGKATYYSVPCYPCNLIQEFWPVCFKTPEIPFEVAATDKK